MLSVLTDPIVCSSEELPSDWGPEAVLKRCAVGDLHALIDTGALVTGYTNRQVAEALLFGVNVSAHEKPCLPPDRFDGVVYLDDEDRKVVLLRQGRKCLALDQSGVPRDRRFSFYDQVHTTGMDIKQSLDARAAITLSKDMTFRKTQSHIFRS